MKKKFKKLLKEATKDFGLTDKAIDNLTNMGCEGLAEDASDEDIQKRVDAVVPFAKEMQAEITRKTRKTQSTEQSDDEGKGEGGKDETVPDWFKPFQEKMTALESENEALKKEKAMTERSGLIATKAKKLGIPEYLLKRISIAEDADIDKELADLRQDLVNNNLMPKEQSHETGTTAEQMKADAQNWAKSLPDFN